MKKAKHSHSASTSHTQQKASMGKQLLVSSAFGTLTGICVFALLLAAFSALCVLFPNPHPFVTPLCFLSVYGAAFFGGFTAVKRNGSRDALLCGGLCGVMLMALFWLAFTMIGYIFAIPNDGSASLICKLIILPVTVIGSFLGASSHSTSPKHRRKR